MFWKKMSIRDDFAPNCSPEVRFGIAAARGYKNLVLLPDDPYSHAFVEKIGQIVADVVNSYGSESKLDNSAESLEKTVLNFSVEQRKATEQKLEPVYEGLRELLTSLQGSVNSGNELSTVASTSTDRLAELKQAPDYESMVKGLTSEITRLQSAVTKHRANEKVIRKVCSEQIETLRERIQVVEKSSQTDYLTKIHSRSSFDNLLRSTFKEVNRGTVYSVAIIDLNGFKLINDQHGHLCGDAALQEFASRLVGYFGKQHCHVARFGGDEFAVLYRGLSSEVEVRIDKVNDSFVRKPMVYQKVHLSLSGSYGAVEIKPDQNIDNILSEADKRMYLNKAIARNAA
jgi:diguanylate cyclase (GGDEF)-like protein